MHGWVSKVGNDFGFSGFLREFSLVSVWPGKLGFVFVSFVFFS